MLWLHFSFLNAVCSNSLCLEYNLYFITGIAPYCSEIAPGLHGTSINNGTKYGVVNTDRSKAVILGVIHSNLMFFE